MPEINNNHPDQSMQEAQAMQQQLATQELPPLPEDRYASLSSWMARKVIKEAKIGKPQKKLSDMLIERKIEMPKKPVKPAPLTEAAKQAANTVEQPQVYKMDEITVNAEKEAAGILDAKIGDFDPDDSWHMNFDTIESEDDIAAVIGAVSEKNVARIDEARRGVITDDQLRGLADDLGQSPEFIQNMLSRKEGMAVNAESVMASRQVLEKSALKLKQLALAMKERPSDQDTRFAFARQYQFHADFMAQFMGMRAEFGRGLRAFGIPQGTNDVQTNRIMEIISQVDNKMDLDKLADNITIVDSTKSINQMTQATAYGKFNLAFDSAYELYINSILSGFKTQYINAAGSMLRMGADLIDTKVAAYMGHWEADPTDAIKADEWKAIYFGQMSGINEALHTAWTVAKTAEQYEGIQKLDGMDMRAITASNYGLSDDSPLGAVVNGIGTVIRAPTERLMGGTDAFFRKVTERGAIAQMAYRKAAAISKHNNMNQADSLALLNDLMENPTEDMIREATNKSLETTFQTPLGKAGRLFQSAVARMPGARYVVPFIKTPVNLMKQGFLERTPLGFLSEQYRQDLMNGGARGQMARSKMATGTALATSMYMLAAQGKITGSEPQDPDVARARKAQGWRPMSIVVENDFGEKEYISYKRLEPFSYAIGSMADLHDQLDESKYKILGEEDEDKFERMATASVIALSENTMERTFMTGIRDVMNVLTDPKRYGKNYINNFANSFVPYAGLRRDITRINDDMIRKHDDIWTYIQKNMPGISADLPPARNVLGEEVKYDAVMNPWPKVVETYDQVLMENGRLAESTRKTALAMPSNKINGVELKAKEYEELILISRKEIKVNGRDYRQTVEGIINSPSYEKLIDEDKVQILRDSTIKFDQAAKSMFLERNPEFMRKAMTRQLHRAAKYKAKEMGIPDEDALQMLQDKYLK